MKIPVFVLSRLLLDKIDVHETRLVESKGSTSPLPLHEMPLHEREEREKREKREKREGKYRKECARGNALLPR